MRLGTSGRIASNEGGADNSIAGEAKAYRVPLVTEDRALSARARQANVTVLPWPRVPSGSSPHRIGTVELGVRWADVRGRRSAQLAKRGSPGIDVVKVRA